MKMRIFTIALLLTFLLMPGASYADIDKPKSHMIVADDLSGVKIAIYNGSQTEISESCKNATEAMFEWMNATVSYVDADQVNDDILYRYDIFVIPPGNLPEYSIDLGTTGKAKIREYVRFGGSVVGISRGAHFACETADVYDTESNWGLNLFNGTGWGPVGGYLFQYMYEVDINKTIPDIDLSTVPDSLTMMGWESIRFQPDGNVPFNTIATYPESGDLPAMISYEMGHGCVFLSGIHPEFEEDGDRDNTAYFDHHEDPETDWPLVLEVTSWMVETSTWNNETTSTSETTSTTSSTTSDTDTNTTGAAALLPIETLVLAGGIGAVVILVMAVGIMKRK